MALMPVQTFKTVFFAKKHPTKEHDLVNDEDLQLSTYLFFFFLNSDIDIAIHKNCEIK